jgi:hypothetical protein
MPAHPSDHAAADCQKYVDAIRAGGFVCLLPQVIDPSWCSPAPLLAGFPLNVHFMGLSEQAGERQLQRLVMASYWFDPATYREDEDVRAMSYFANVAREYHVEVIYWKRKQQWEGRKYRADQLLLTAEGYELQRLILQLTLCGISLGEPARAIQRQETASAGAFVFMPEDLRS